MMSVASRWAGWSRRSGGAVAAPPGAGRAGVSFMRDSLGPDARLIVEVAWGADPSGNPDLWSWTDITPDVQQAGGQKISMKLGRADEASTTQPAQCTFQVDNRAGLYSKGVQSPNWPNVKRNVPLRVRVDPNGTGPIVLWQGYVTSMTPGWDSTGRNAIVSLTANGALRRLIQGSSPIISAYRRGVLNTTTRVAYWPCEDQTTATSFAPGLTTHGPMTIAGTANLHSNTDFLGSDAIPIVKSSVWSGRCPVYPNTGNNQVQVLVSWPTAGTIPDLTVVMSVFTTGTAGRWDLIYGTGGSMYFKGYDQNNNLIGSAGPISFNVDDRRQLITVSLETSGSDVIHRMVRLDQGGSSGGIWSTTVSGYSVTAVKSVVINPNGNLGNVAVGHVVVRNTNNSAFINMFEFNANFGEDPLTRIQRLCSENNVPITIYATHEYSRPYYPLRSSAAAIYPAVVTQNTLMGYQKQDTLVGLLRQCEATEGGILYDGANAGLTYISRQVRENHAVSMTLDASSGQLADFAPVDDDQGAVNRAAANRYLGSSATYEDTDGPMGTAAIGVYDTSFEVNNHDDSYLDQYASWAVHKGSRDSYRYPSANIDLAHDPVLATTWAAMATDLSARVDVTNIEAVRTQYPAGTISSMVEGVQHSIDQFRWNVTLNMSSFDAWRIGTLARDTGDSSETLIRLDTDGAHLATAAVAGATTLAVVTPSGPLWTTRADDFPFDVNAGGRQVTVTNIVTNFVPNPGFESGTAPWFASGAVLAQSATQVHTGAFAGRVTPDGVSGQCYIQSDLAAVTPGQQLTVSGWVWFTSSVTANFSMSVNFFDAGQNYMSTSSVNVSVPATTWTQVSNTFAVPSGAAFAAAVPLLGGTPAAAQVWYADDVSLTVPGRQIFTVAALATGLPAGADVALWHPYLLGL